MDTVTKPQSIFGCARLDSRWIRGVYRDSGLSILVIISKSVGVEDWRFDKKSFD